MKFLDVQLTQSQDFVKNLELKYNLSFFDRLIVKYKKNNEDIKSTSLNEFKTICKTKMIDDDITVLIILSKILMSLRTFGKQTFIIVG